MTDDPGVGTGHHLRIDTYLAVPSEGRLAFPRFQFNNAGELWPGFSDVLTVFRNGAWDDVSTGLWFISRQSRLDAVIPALMIREDPSRVLSLAQDIVDDWWRVTRLRTSRRVGRRSGVCLQVLGEFRYPGPARGARPAVAECSPSSVTVTGHHQSLRPSRPSGAGK